MPRIRFFNGVGDVCRGTKQAQAGRYIEKRFIKRQALDQWGEFAENREDLLRDGLVLTHLRRDTNEVGTTTPGFRVAEYSNTNPGMRSRQEKMASMRFD